MRSNGIVNFALVLAMLSLIVGGIICVVAYIQFDRNCEGYLKRAADANTVELAIENLERSVTYLKQEGMTSGYTSVLYQTPDEDIGFWYKNLSTALEELKAVRPEATALEKTNILMKLRETLMDQGDKKSAVTVPSGISRFPWNSLFALWLTVTVIVGAAGFVRGFR